jgi:predicted nicotinamide N-methyase
LSKPTEFQWLSQHYPSQPQISPYLDSVSKSHEANSPPPQREKSDQQDLSPSVYSQQYWDSMVVNSRVVDSKTHQLRGQHNLSLVFLRGRMDVGMLFVDDGGWSLYLL